VARPAHSVIRWRMRRLAASVGVGGALAGTTRLVTAPDPHPLEPARRRRNRARRLTARRRRHGTEFAAALGLSQPFTGGTYVAHQSGSLAAARSWSRIVPACSSRSVAPLEPWVYPPERSSPPPVVAVRLRRRPTRRRRRRSNTRRNARAGRRSVLRRNRGREAATGSPPRFIPARRPHHRGLAARFHRQDRNRRLCLEAFVPRNAESGQNLRAADVNNTRARRRLLRRAPASDVSHNHEDRRRPSIRRSRRPPAAAVTVRVTDENNVPLVGSPSSSILRPVQTEEAHRHRHAGKPEPGSACHWPRCPRSPPPSRPPSRHLCRDLARRSARQLPPA
jgi:hypothetical protein